MQKGKMTKRDIAWELYALYDYCMCGYSVNDLMGLKKKELIRMLKGEKERNFYEHIHRRIK